MDGGCWVIGDSQKRSELTPITLFLFLESVGDVLCFGVKVDVASGLGLNGSGTHDVGHIYASCALEHVEGLSDGYGNIAR